MAIPKYTPKDTERFWSKVNKDGSIPEHRPELGPCWEWQGACDSSGYGSKDINHKIVSTHRLSWTLVHGDIPDGFYVCHSCDNPNCVNPKHLWLGTSQDNALDRSIKGRNRKQHNENNSHWKLTNEQVSEIRKRYSLGGISWGKLAVVFGISKTQVGRIIRHETRKTNDV